MKKLYLIESFIISLFICMFSGSVEAQNYCNFIQKVQAYQAFYDSLRYERITNDDSISLNGIDTTLFNINKYMKMFDKVTIPPEYECQVYFVDYFLGGEPILYVKEKKFDVDKYIEQKVIEKGIPANASAEEYKDYLFYKFVNEPQRRAFNNIKPDSTDEGFLQYLFFNQMGEQFGLEWHSKEFQKSVICSDYEMIKIINDYKNGNNKLIYLDNSAPQDFQAFTLKIIDKKKLFEVDSFVKIKMLQDKCFISWYEFESHHGIFIRSYLINRYAPYQIEKVVDDKIADIIMNFDY